MCFIKQQFNLFKNDKPKFIEEIFDSKGAELFSDLFVESYYSISKYMETSNKIGFGDGFYVCNCGEWYYTLPCGVSPNDYF